MYSKIIKHNRSFTMFIFITHQQSTTDNQTGLNLILLIPKLSNYIIYNINIIYII